MKGIALDLEKAAEENSDFRRVIYTARYTQLVLMSLKPGEEIGSEVHGLDQFIRIEQGKASVVLNDGETNYSLEDGGAVIIPAGTKHNVINTGNQDLKLYTLYSPPNHQDKTVHQTKADAKEEHFDGQTTE